MDRNEHCADNGGSPPTSKVLMGKELVVTDLVTKLGSAEGAESSGRERRMTSSKLFHRLCKKESPPKRLLERTVCSRRECIRGVHSNRVGGRMTKFVRVREVTEVLASRCTGAYTLIREGTLPSVRIAGGIRFRSPPWRSSPSRWRHRRSVNVAARSPTNRLGST